MTNDTAPDAPDAPGSLALAPWCGERGLEVLRRQNTAELTEHLGGVESGEQVRRRHERYLAMTDASVGRMFLLLLDGEAAGSVGYWRHAWEGREVYETGYAVLPEFQGRGLAVRALLLCARRAAGEGVLEWLHAFPSVRHEASNAVCRRAGFELVGEVAFEYPPGHRIRSNNWRLALAG
ncbi:GNAT family N-acetyltransferase [Kitasatospora sp. NPDC096128]|uniref:GNAT family N-acetyltransferase n=1 Tax=Kitasatospora sp. NPDC096128 TaxID=3155547 RepID=UPI00332486C7